MKDLNDIFKEVSSKNNILKKIFLIKDLREIVNDVFNKYGFSSVEVINVDLKTSTLFLYVKNNYLKQEILFRKHKIIKTINDRIENIELKNIKFAGGVNK